MNITLQPDDLMDMSQPEGHIRSVDVSDLIHQDESQVKVIYENLMPKHIFSSRRRSLERYTIKKLLFLYYNQRVEFMDKGGDFDLELFINIV